MSPINYSSPHTYLVPLDTGSFEEEEAGERGAKAGTDQHKVVVGGVAGSIVLV